MTEYRNTESAMLAGNLCYAGFGVYASSHPSFSSTMASHVADAETRCVTNVARESLTWLNPMRLNDSTCIIRSGAGSTLAYAVNSLLAKNLLSYLRPIMLDALISFTRITHYGQPRVARQRSAGQPTLRIYPALALYTVGTKGLARG